MKLLFLIVGIIWGQKEISWDDFKIVPANYAASSATEINLDYNIKNGKYYFTVSAVFHPEASYVSEETNHRRSESILLHERIHFDITELHCRNLRRAIKNYSGCGAIGFNEVVRAYNKELELLDIEQRRYDYETEHSQNEYMQRQWETEVKDRLKRK